VDPSWTDITSTGFLGAQLTVLALVAAVAWRQVAEARRLREQQARPFVVIDFEIDIPIISLVVSNVGRTMARKARFSFSPELTSSLDRPPDLPFRELKMFTEGIPSLPPGKRLPVLFDSGISRKPEDGHADVYHATIIYEGADGRQYTDEMTLDLGIYWNVERLNLASLDDVHKRLKEISDTLKGWRASGGGILTVTPADQHARNEEHRAAIERRQAKSDEAQDSGPGMP
jgi:hypothetical protein